MAITIALAGNPNCGKTTMFNALTGANQYVGNWPGVTVEKKEGKVKSKKAKGYHPAEVTNMEACIGCTSCARTCPDVVIRIEKD